MYMYCTYYPFVIFYDRLAFFARFAAFWSIPTPCFIPSLFVPFPCPSIYLLLHFRSGVLFCLARCSQIWCGLVDTYPNKLTSISKNCTWWWAENKVQLKMKPNTKTKRTCKLRIEKIQKWCPSKKTTKKWGNSIGLPFPCKSYLHAMNIVLGYWTTATAAPNIWYSSYCGSCQMY